jgi:hypothetical protein
MAIEHCNSLRRPHGVDYSEHVTVTVTVTIGRLRRFKLQVRTVISDGRVAIGLAPSRSLAANGVPRRNCNYPDVCKPLLRDPDIQMRRPDMVTTSADLSGNLPTILSQKT